MDGNQFNVNLKQRALPETWHAGADANLISFMFTIQLNEKKTTTKYMT